MQSSEATKTAMLQEIELAFEHNSLTEHDDILLNGINVEEEIRTPALSSQMSSIVRSPAVRQRLWQEQKRIWQHGGIVVDGRDMGTVVFPEAELKLFLVGDIAIRAQRRHQEMIARGRPSSLEEIMHDIRTRDHTDYLWEDAVNYKASDALELDTSKLTIDEQIDYVYQLAIKIINW